MRWQALKCPESAIALSFINMDTDHGHVVTSSPYSTSTSVVSQAVPADLETLNIPLIFQVICKTVDVLEDGKNLSTDNMANSMAGNLRINVVKHGKNVAT